jgi:hypothetical protein
LRVLLVVLLVALVVALVVVLVRWHAGMLAAPVCHQAARR